MPEFVPGDQNFVPNLVWLLLHLYLACLIGSYPQRDLLEIGVQLWPRCGSRCAWWISKCIWTAVSCLLFYLLILGVPWLFLFFGMTPDLLPQREIQQYFSSAAVAGIPFGRMLVHTLLLPLLASISLSLFQITLAMLTRPLFGLHAVTAVRYPPYSKPYGGFPATILCPHAACGEIWAGTEFSFFPARPVFLPLRRLPKNRPA